MAAPRTIITNSQLTIALKLQDSHRPSDLNVKCIAPVVSSRACSRKYKHKYKYTNTQIQFSGEDPPGLGGSGAPQPNMGIFAMMATMGAVPVPMPVTHQPNTSK